MYKQLSTALNEKVEVLELVQDSDRYFWSPRKQVWASVELESGRKNLFSSNGISAMGATFVVRYDVRLTLNNAFCWNGRHCFLTDIIVPGGRLGYMTVKAALVEVRMCRKDADLDPPGCSFPGIITEKYVGHEEPDLHAEVTTDYVLVTPKEISLDPGSWVTVGEAFYRVLVPHLLDPYKNEFEIRRKEDC